MPKISQLTDLAKTYFERRGGTDAAKQDVKEVENIMRGPGSFIDKARRSADRLKSPGGPAETTATSDGHAAAPATRAGSSTTATPPHDQAG
jgi:hypothetical protein